MSADTAVQPIPAVSNTPTAPGRMDFLDGLRALAALFVVFHHEYGDAQGSAVPLPHRIARLYSFLELGHYAVDLFIVLSGFCLMLPVVRGDGLLRGGAWAFFRKRARRILPPYYAAVVLSLGLIATVIGKPTGTFWDGCLPVTRAALVAHALLLQDLFASTAWKINHVLWSVSVEWRIYFVFPLLVLAWKRWGGVAVTVGALTASACLLTLLSRSPINLSPTGACPQYLGLFALGTFGAGVVYGKPLAAWRGAPWAWISLGFLGLFLGLSKIRIWHHDLLPIAWTDYFVGAWAASLLIQAARTPHGLLGRALSCRPLAFLGTFAYSIYLMHPPLLQLFWQYVLLPLGLAPTARFFCALIFGTGLIIAVSYLFFLAFERPFLNTRRTRLETAAALSPAP